MMNSKHDRICTIPKPAVFLNVAPTASLSRQLLCKIHWLILPCDWHHDSAEFLRSRKNLLLETRRQLSSGHWMVWHPYSAIKFYWDCFVATIMFVVFIYMPFQVFLYCPPANDAFILLCDAVALIDIGTNFITGYTDEDNKQVVIEPKFIARRYIKGVFFADFIAALPLQLYSMYKDCTFPTHTVFYVFKLPRLCSMERKWTNLRKQLELSYIATALTTVMFRTILFFHWMTYIHFQVPVLCYYLYDLDVEWVKRFRSVWMPFDSVLKNYVANLYLTCGLCVGAGYYTPVSVNVMPELLLTSFMGITGLFFYIYCFTTLLRLVMYIQQESFQHHGRLKELEQYMALKRLPRLLKNKIMLYLNHEFSEGYFNEAHIMNTINEQLKCDINMHCCKRLVDNVPMLKGMPVALINTIIFCLTRVLYMPGETVVQYNKPLSRMYLICSGTVAVMNSAGREIAHLRDGAFFGEDALLEPGIVQGSTIIALEITEIYTLTSEQFQSCLIPYPHFRRRLIASLPQRQSQDSQ